MSFVKECFDTPVCGEYDIIVVGAGPAGCGAAISAARNGMKTLIVDKFNALGGMWTASFMNPIFDYRNKEGILLELIDELKKNNQWGGFWDSSYNYEYMKYILDKKMDEAGVNVLLNTQFSRTITDGKQIQGIVVENSDGRQAYYAKIIFDCTGDGAVAVSAGCEYEIGIDGDFKQCQAMTLMFLVGNIPEKYCDGLMIGKILDACYEKAGLEAPFHMPYLIPVPNTHFGVIQFTHMYEYNPLSTKAITEANAEGRRQIIECFELLKTYSKDFKDLELICSAPTLGVRESRRIIGEYTLTLEDILSENNEFEDGICTVTFNIDIHPKDGKAQDCRKLPPYQIPFRCLIPKGYDGIIVAGRCISGSHEAMASYRVTGNCCQMGENAATIAAYAIKNNINIRSVNVKDI